MKLATVVYEARCYDRMDTFEIPFTARTNKLHRFASRVCRKGALDLTAETRTNSQALGLVDVAVHDDLVWR